jgi:serine/threonine-protein kinase RsbW
MTTNIKVVIPAEPRFLRIARLTVAGVAGEVGFGLRDIEDLRVAIDEMCAVVIEDAEPGLELALHYRVDGDRLEIEGHCKQVGPAPDIHPVARELLAMTADEFDVSNNNGGRTFRLVKHRTDPTD